MTVARTRGETALRELTAAYENRWAKAAGVRQRGLPVVGFVGGDVPMELITAAGALPLRLAGEPAESLGVGERILGSGTDPVAISILTGLVERRYSCDLLLISQESDACRRLFYAIRELRRMREYRYLPPAAVVGVVHLPRQSSLSYTEQQLHLTAGRLRRHLEADLGPDDLARAIAEHNSVRAVQRQFRALRSSVPPRVSGAESLAVYGAGTCTPAFEYAGLLADLVADWPSIPVREGERVFLTGSSHDDPLVYRALEALGLLIVGEDHDWGDALADVDVPRPDLSGVAERYHSRTAVPQRSSPMTRARQTGAGVDRTAPALLIAYQRHGDPAPAWDFAAQQRVAAAHGITAITLARQPYGGISSEAASRIRQAVSEPGARAEEFGGRQ
jgi:hypothetical protein